MQAFVFNTRRPLFQDPLVRQALGARPLTSCGPTGRCSSPSTPATTPSLPTRTTPPRPAGCGRAAPARTPARPGAGRGVHPAAGAAVHRTAEQPARQHARGENPARTGRLDDCGAGCSPIRRRNLPFRYPAGGFLVPAGDRAYAANLRKLGIAVDYRTIDPACTRTGSGTSIADMVVTSFGQSQSPGNEQARLLDQPGGGPQGFAELAGIHSRRWTPWWTRSMPTPRSS